MEAAAAIRELARISKDELNRLDGVQGDGDLGITVELIAEAVYQAAQESRDFKTWLTMSGLLVRRKAPSTIGGLISFALTAAGRSLPEGAQPTPGTLVEIQRQMIEEIRKRGVADRGDRTVLDAFIPAFEAYRDCALTGETTRLALEKVIEAALEGAQSTRNLIPRTGRASWIGERAIGEVDGGAWLCYKVYQTLCGLA